MPYLELLPDFKQFYTIDDWTDSWTRPATVLLVHGFPECAEAWRGWVPYLARHYRVIRIDVRGFGHNDPVSEDFVFSDELFVDDLVRVINHVAKEPVHVAGIKSGGIMVVKLAAMRPDLVKTITVMAPPVVAVPAVGWVDHIKQHGMRSWARFSNSPRFGSKLPARALDWWVDMYGSAPVSTVLPYLNWAGANDIRADLEHVACPTLVVKSKTPRRSASELDAYNRIPKVEYAEIPVEGYHAAGIDPDTCARAMLEFIGRHP